jgi:hypothetical protein
MIATLERQPALVADPPRDFDVFLRLTSGTSRVRVTEWAEAAWLRRKLHDRGWVCTSPSPTPRREDYCFFVTRGPATVRRNLVAELQSLAEVNLVFETA